MVIRVMKTVRNQNRVVCGKEGQVRPVGILFIPMEDCNEDQKEHEKTIGTAYKIHRIQMSFEEPERQIPTHHVRKGAICKRPLGVWRGYQTRRRSEVGDHVRRVRPK